MRRCSDAWRFVIGLVVRDSLVCWKATAVNHLFRSPVDRTAFSAFYKDRIKTASGVDAERSEDASRRFNYALAEHARVKRMLRLRCDEETISKVILPSYAQGMC